MISLPGLRFDRIAGSPSCFGTMGKLPLSWKTETPSCKYLVTDGVPAFHFHMRLERDPRYYMSNVVVPLAVITGLVMIAFALPIEDLNDRMSVVLTLLLTAVAFKYVVSSYLPKVTYLTLLDKYILSSLILIFCTAAENAFVYLGREGDGAQEVDYIAAAIYGSLWLLLNVGFLLGSQTRLFYESWDEVEKRRQRLQAERDASFQYAPDEPPTLIGSDGDGGGVSIA